MVYKRFRFKNKKEVLMCAGSFSVSPAIQRELMEYRRLGDKYPFRDD